MMNKCFLSDEEAFFKYFSFLNNDYGCNLKAIDISNCDIVEKALCIFNTSGCFTIQTFPAHFDYNFYVSKKFSMKREELLEKKNLILFKLNGTCGKPDKKNLIVSMPVFLIGLKVIKEI